MVVNQPIDASATLDLRFELPELNTWRAFNKSVSQEAVMDLVQQWESRGYRLGAVCIDDGWQISGLMGVWDACPKRFPDPGRLSRSLHQRGYGVRLWVAPAQVHPGTPIFEQAWPDSLLKNRSGKPSFYTGLGTYTLDIRTNLGREHVMRTMQKVASEWNADAFKVDFPPFYQPDDEFYQLRAFDLPEKDKQSMVSDFYALVRGALDSVRPNLRIEAYSHCHLAQPHINDCTCGDLVGCDRSWAPMAEHARTLRAYTAGHPIVPWFEMVWGEGGDNPHPGVEWHAGFLEYMATSINLGLKIEHSFAPFDYPNADQVRCLSNLYGPRNPQVKVLVAGRRTYTVEELRTSGVALGLDTRFLVAPETDMVATLHTAALESNAIDWRGRNVLTGQPVILRARNEFWGGNPLHCRVEFDAKAHQVYELWCEGTKTDYFTKMLDQHGSR